MAVCSFNMQFIFVWAGWEDNAHDTRIFLKAIDNSSINFPKPLEGCDLKINWWLGRKMFNFFFSFVIN